MSTNGQDKEGMPMSSSLTDNISADERCVISSEEIAIEEGVGDNDAGTEQRSTYL